MAYTTTLRTVLNSLLLDSGLVEHWYHLAVIPAEAGIHIKLIYKAVVNKPSLKNHAGIGLVADQPGIQ